MGESSFSGAKVALPDGIKAGRPKAPPPAAKAVAKSDNAYRTIAEVAAELGVATHVLRFWESKFVQLKPTKQSGGRRFYKPEDVALLRYIQQLLYRDGYTIRGVQAALKQTKPRELKALVQQLTPQAVIAELASIRDLLQMDSAIAQDEVVR